MTITISFSYKPKIVDYATNFTLQIVTLFDIFISN